MRPIEFIKVRYACSKQLGNLMCMETEMFRVTMSEISKTNYLQVPIILTSLAPVSSYAHAARVLTS